MNRPSIVVSPDFLRSRLIPAAAIAYILSAATGLAGMLFLLLPGSGQVMMQDMFMGGITDRSALMTWQVINIAMTVICFLWAVMMSLCLIGSLTNRAGKGLNLVYHSSRICVKVLDIAGICALALLIYKLAAYIIRNFNLNDWLYLVYAMLISEALMVVLAWLSYRLLRKFLNCLCDSAASMGYTLSSGILDYPTIPGFTATGFLLLGFVSLLAFADRFFTVTIVWDYVKDHYALLIADHPLLILSGAAFFFSSLGCFLMAGYTRRYKRKAERRLFESVKR